MKTYYVTIVNQEVNEVCRILVQATDKKQAKRKAIKYCDAVFFSYNKNFVSIYLELIKYDKDGIKEIFA